jgi:PIN domain nuclease of toxin-antitoxin system
MGGAAMKLLLDTHIWIWSILEPDKLSAKVRRELEDPENEIWISPISTWEILTLARKKKLILDADPVSWVQEVLDSMCPMEAPLTNAIAVQSHALDLPHSDPADRFLAATAQVYGLTLVTADRQLLRSKQFSWLANR